MPTNRSSEAYTGTTRVSVWFLLAALSRRLEVPDRKAQHCLQQGRARLMVLVGERRTHILSIRVQNDNQRAPVRTKAPARGGLRLPYGL